MDARWAVLGPLNIYLLSHVHIDAPVHSKVKPYTVGMPARKARSSPCQNTLAPFSATTALNLTLPNRAVRRCAFCARAAGRPVTLNACSAESVTAFSLRIRMQLKCRITDQRIPDVSFARRGGAWRRGGAALQWRGSRRGGHLSVVPRAEGGAEGVGGKQPHEVQHFPLDRGIAAIAATWALDNCQV